MYVFMSDASAWQRMYRHLRKYAQCGSLHTYVHAYVCTYVRAYVRAPVKPGACCRSPRSTTMLGRTCPSQTRTGSARQRRDLACSRPYMPGHVLGSRSGSRRSGGASSAAGLRVPCVQRRKPALPPILGMLHRCYSVRSFVDTQSL